MASVIEIALFPLKCWIVTYRPVIGEPHLKISQFGDEGGDPAIIKIVLKFVCLVLKILIFTQY